ncbi:hypothetical protein [Pigmentiphaga litoralis]|uniref:hypothetical protein n=1 Tax=Pigmentiphaga litoralis TaxID=516702 RepID=UPI00389AB3AA
MLGFLLRRAEFAAGSGMCLQDMNGTVFLCNATLLKPVAFRKQFDAPSLMFTDSGKQQSYAQMMSFQFANIADPAKDELATLPDGEHQKFIVQMAAVIQKSPTRRSTTSRARIPSVSPARKSIFPARMARRPLGSA